MPLVQEKVHIQDLYTSVIDILLRLWDSLIHKNVTEE